MAAVNRGHTEGFSAQADPATAALAVKRLPLDAGALLALVKAFDSAAVGKLDVRNYCRLGAQIMHVLWNGNIQRWLERRQADMRYLQLLRHPEFTGDAWRVVLALDAYCFFEQHPEFVDWNPPVRVLRMVLSVHDPAEQAGVAVRARALGSRGSELRAELNRSRRDSVPPGQKRVGRRVREAAEHAVKLAERWPCDPFEGLDAILDSDDSVRQSHIRNLRRIHRDSGDLLAALGQAEREKAPTPILFVDDEEPVTRSVRRALAIAGYRTLCLTRGAALALEPHAPVGIFAARLPDGYGIEAARTLLASGRIQRAIFYVEETDQAVLERAAAIGEIVPRSAGIDRVIALVRRLLTS